jgi:hypothetical protein
MVVAAVLVIQHQQVVRPEDQAAVLLHLLLPQGEQERPEKVIMAAALPLLVQ